MTDTGRRPPLPGFSLCDDPACPCGHYTPVEDICEEWASMVPNRFLRCARCGAARHRHANPGTVDADLEQQVAAEFLGDLTDAIAQLQDRLAHATAHRPAGMAELQLVLDIVAPACAGAAEALTFLELLARDATDLIPAAA